MKTHAQRMPSTPAVLALRCRPLGVRPAPSPDPHTIVILEIVVATVLAALAWFAIDSLRAREAAVAAARHACVGDGVQFLDDTVMLASVRLVRNAGGNVTLQRIYHFEFSDTGDNRLAGAITLTGASVDTLYLEPHRGPAVAPQHRRL